MAAACWTWQRMARWGLQLLDVTLVVRRKVGEAVSTSSFQVLVQQGCSFPMPVEECGMKADLSKNGDKISEREEKGGAFGALVARRHGGR